METTQFIATLLKAEGKVSIPGLGTITASQGIPGTLASAEPSPGEQTGNDAARGSDSFFPFTGRLSFSEKHEKGNRTLAGEIAGSRQINPNLAGYEVDKFVIRVKQELSRNGSFEFPGMGRLNTKPGGKIGFESYFNDHALFGLSPVVLNPLDRGGNVVEVITRKIGFKNVRKNKFKRSEEHTSEIHSLKRI